MSVAQNIGKYLLNSLSEEFDAYLESKVQQYLEKSTSLVYVQNKRRVVCGMIGRIPVYCEVDGGGGGGNTGTINDSTLIKIEATVVVQDTSGLTGSSSSVLTSSYLTDANKTLRVNLIQNTLIDSKSANTKWLVINNSLNGNGNIYIPSNTIIYVSGQIQFNDTSNIYYTLYFNQGILKIFRSTTSEYNKGTVVWTSSESSYRENLDKCVLFFSPKGQIEIYKTSVVINNYILLKSPDLIYTATFDNNYDYSYNIDAYVFSNTGINTQDKRIIYIPYSGTSGGTGSSAISSAVK